MSQKGAIYWAISSGELRQFESPAPAGARHLKRKSVPLPVFYCDNSSLTTVYTASIKKVRGYLPDPGMYPLEATPGRCLLAFTAFEYRKTDIDPYNEFSIGVLINFGKRALPGFSLIEQFLAKRCNALVWLLPARDGTTSCAELSGIGLGKKALTYQYGSVNEAVLFGP